MSDLFNQHRDMAHRGRAWYQRGLSASEQAKEDQVSALVGEKAALLDVDRETAMRVLALICEVAIANRPSAQAMYLTQDETAEALDDVKFWCSAPEQ